MVCSFEYDLSAIEIDDEVLWHAHFFHIFNLLWIKWTFCCKIIVIHVMVSIDMKNSHPGNKFVNKEYQLLFYVVSIQFVYTKALFTRSTVLWLRKSKYKKTPCFIFFWKSSFFGRVYFFSSCALEHEYQCKYFSITFYAEHFFFVQQKKFKTAKQCFFFFFLNFIWEH